MVGNPNLALAYLFHAPKQMQNQWRSNPLNTKVPQFNSPSGIISIAQAAAAVTLLDVPRDCTNLPCIGSTIVVLQLMIWDFEKHFYGNCLDECA